MASPAPVRGRIGPLLRVPPVLLGFRTATGGLPLRLLFESKRRIVSRTRDFLEAAEVGLVGDCANLPLTFVPVAFPALTGLGLAPSLASSLLGRLMGRGIRDFDTEVRPLLSDVGVVIVGVVVESLGNDIPPMALVLQEEGVAPRDNNPPSERVGVP